MKRFLIAMGMLILQSLDVVSVRAQFSGDEIRREIIARWLQAAQDDDTAMLDRHLAYGINIDVQEDDGQTAVMKAAEYGCTEAVKYLIEQGALLDLQDWCCNTALIKASINGHDDLVKLLIAAKAKLTLRNSLGGTALIEAAVFGQTTTVRLLISAMKATYEAGAAYMTIDDLRELMLSDLINPLDIQDDSGRTALMEATLYGYAEIVALLIDAGANPLIKDCEGCTARMLLRQSSLKNKKEVLSALKGEAIFPAPKKRRVTHQIKSKTNI
ncbi:MAG: ankyrin repeat domain-containing protein [Candidatus Babeliales bacterium]|jgi:ankyrin repeat protein